MAELDFFLQVELLKLELLIYLVLFLQELGSELLLLLHGAQLIVFDHLNALAVFFDLLQDQLIARILDFLHSVMVLQNQVLLNLLFNQLLLHDLLVLVPPLFSPFHDILLSSQYFVVLPSLFFLNFFEVRSLPLSFHDVKPLSLFAELLDLLLLE